MLSETCILNYQTCHCFQNDFDILEKRHPIVFKKDFERLLHKINETGTIRRLVLILISAFKILLTFRLTGRHSRQPKRKKVKRSNDIEMTDISQSHCV